MRRALTIWLFGGLALSAWTLAAQAAGVAELTKSLADENPKVRLEAADDLAKATGSEAPQAAAALAGALADKSDEVR